MSFVQNVFILHFKSLYFALINSMNTFKWIVMPVISNYYGISTFITAQHWSKIVTYPIKTF